MTFVLIHGAWHGGWCWRYLRPFLRGHDVYAPSLTARPGTDLEMHIQEVVSLLETEDLHDVVLVGHSYGGMVVTGAADRVPARIGRLVYLDAFVPEDGKCLLDYAVPERAAGMREEGERTGSVTPPPLSLWGVTEQRHVDFIKPREVRHPFATMAQPIKLSGKANGIPRTFIYCSSPATGSFDQFAAKVRGDPAWRFHELKTGHDAMILVPEQLAALLQK